MKSPTLALLETSGIGRKSAIKICRFMQREGSESSEWSAQALLQLIERARSEHGRIRLPSLEQVQQGVDRARRIAESEREAGVSIVDMQESRYPSSLRDIPDPPALLHVKTNRPVDTWWSDPKVAVIGTRDSSEHGRRVAYRLGEVCATEGFAVVSGLALGCDTAAHEGVLDAGGKTIAVLAHGLDEVRPARNKELAQRIVEQGGMLVSEYAFGTASWKGQYVERNRIQSGLSRGVIVVEADEKSGTLHTVKYASEQERALAVYEPESQYNVATGGNERAKREYKATGVADASSLKEFLDRCQRNDTRA